MQLNIPTQFEPIIRQRATAAGFDDVEKYIIQRLVTEDGDPEVEAYLRGKQDQIEKLIDEAYAAGPPTPLTKDDFQQARERLARQLEPGS